MKISHKIVNISGEDRVYIYVTVDDIYEFGKENFGNGEDTNFLKTLRLYVKNNLKELSKAAVIIVINGVALGTLTLASLMPKEKNINVSNNQTLSKVEVYTEQGKTQDVKQENENNGIEEKEQEEHKEIVNNNSVQPETNNQTNVTSNKSTSTTSNKTNTTSNKSTTTTSNKTNATSNKSTTTTSNKTNATSNKSTTTTKNQTNTTTINTTATSNKQTSTSNTANTTTNTTTKAEEKLETTEKAETVASGRTIKFSNNGVISNMDLEEYVIGVVAAEMPASFQSEALKAQAVVARTYAMKKASSGITLVNSTSHQVYNSVEQMKAKWGSSFSTYYNKIKNAVNATKGMVLKYNGSYIEALYYAISNGSSELPKYVWSNSYPYLQAVSSSWDENISAGKYSVTITYTKLSEKLGITVTKDTNITILSRTEGDRVAEIKIGDKTFTGVKIRGLLGLRSADFEIVKTDTGVKITTHGYGHGVGMSQYGANGAAKSGYTYKQILNHYYPSAILSSI